MTRFTREIAKDAVETAMPFINHIMQELGRTGLGVKVGLRRPDKLSDTPLYSLQIGEPAEWKHPYLKIAESKYYMTQETGRPSREVQLLYPEMAGASGQTVYWGSWIDGFIIVATSGLPPEWDEVCSKLICGIIRARLTTQSKEDFASDKDFT